MRRLRSLLNPVLLFFVSVAAPFVASFGFFLTSERHSVLTTPQEYIETIKREGSLNYMISLAKWKHALASDPDCQAADVVIIGSSRTREIDRTVTGRPTCNLYVDGLGAVGFESLSRALPPRAPDRRAQTVYLSLDHFWFWNGRTDWFEPVELAMLEHTPSIWRVYAAASTLRFFQWRDLFEVQRRQALQAHPRFEDETSIWYPDGHLLNPHYYAEKRAGRRNTITQATADEFAFNEFGNGPVRDANMTAFADGVQRLHQKGYAVRAYWSPVSPAHIEAGRRLYPAIFQETIDRVDQAAAGLPFDRYLRASRTIDATRLGCRTDWADTTHADLDCVRVFFPALFPGEGR